jgi:hypothetical protein
MGIIQTAITNGLSKATARDDLQLLIATHPIKKLPTYMGFYVLTTVNIVASGM